MKGRRGGRREGSKEERVLVGGGGGSIEGGGGGVKRGDTMGRIIKDKRFHTKNDIKHFIFSCTVKKNGLTRVYHGL